MITTVLTLQHQVGTVIPVYADSGTPTSYFFLIDDTNFFLIDDTHKLILQ